MLTGLLTQAALLLLLLLLEFSEFPEGVDEGLDLEGVEEEEPEDGEVEEVGLGVATLFWIGSSEPGVVVVVVGVGWPAGTEVDWADGVGVVAGGLALVGLGDPPPPLVMVKVGEMLPEFPIKAMMYVLPSGYPLGTVMSTCPAVIGNPLARGDLSCKLYPPRLSIHPRTTCPMGLVI